MANEKSLLFAILVIATCLSHSTSQVLPPPDGSSSSVFVSPPYNGTGNWSGLSVQLEVTNVNLTTDSSGAGQARVDHNFLLTDPQGNQSRTNTSSFIQSISGGTDVTVNVSRFNASAGFQLIVAGTYLDLTFQLLFSLALKQAYRDLNSAWAAKSNISVVVSPSSAIGSSGEFLTLVQYWLVSGSDQTPESPAGIVQPSDVYILTYLAQFGVSTTSYGLSQQQWYKYADSFGLYVYGSVQYIDYQYFQILLQTFWQSSPRLSAYRNYSVNIIGQEPYYSESGANITRIIYTLGNGNVTLDRSTFNSTPPAVEELLQIQNGSIPITPVSGQEQNGSYQLVSTNVTIYSGQQSFSTLLTDQPVGNVTQNIQQQLQPFVAGLQIYAGATVKVLTFEEVFSEQKLVSFYKVYWHLTIGGKRLDGRRHQTLFPPAKNVSKVLQGITLPNGRQITVIYDRTIAETHIKRSSCFKVVVDGTSQNYSAVQQVLYQLLTQRFSSLPGWKARVPIAYNEENIDVNGSSVYVFYFTIAAQYGRYLDASVFPQFRLSTSDFSQVTGQQFRLSDVNLRGKLERARNMLKIFIRERPLKGHFKSFSDSLTSIFVGRYLGNVATRVIRAEEQGVPGSSERTFAVRYFLNTNGLIQYPEAVQPFDDSHIQVPTPRGRFFSIVPAASVSVDSTFSTDDLFSFDLPISIARGLVAKFERKLTAAAQASPAFASWPSVRAQIVKTEEVVTANGSSIFRVFYRILSGIWTVTAKKFGGLAPAELTQVVANERSPAGQQYFFIPPQPVPVVSDQDLVSVVINRPVLQGDFDLLAKVLGLSVGGSLNSTAGAGLNITIVRQGPVSVCTYPFQSSAACKKSKKRSKFPLPGKPTPWQIDLIVTVNNDTVEEGVFPANVINDTNFEQQLNSTASPPYGVVASDTDQLEVVDSSASSNITFSSPPTDEQLNKTFDLLDDILTAQYNGSDVEIVHTTPAEVVSQNSNGSSYVINYETYVNGTLVDGSVEAPLNVTQFNQMTNQSQINIPPLVSPNSTSDNIDVDSLVRFILTDDVSDLDLGVLSQALQVAIRRQLSPALSNAIVTVVQKQRLVSDSGDVYTEIRAKIVVNGIVVPALTFPSLDVGAALSSVMLTNGNSVVQNSDSVPQFFDQRTVFSFVLQVPVNDADKSAIAQRITALYAQLKRLAGKSLNVKVLNQVESYSQNGYLVFIVHYALQADDDTVDSRIQPSQNQTQVQSALTGVPASGNNNQSDYGSAVPSNISASQDLVPYSVLYQLTFQQQVAQAIYSQIEYILAQVYRGFNFTVLGQQDYVDQNGQINSQLLISVKSTTNQQLSASNLPSIDWNLLLGAFANLPSGPSGANYSLANTSSTQQSRIDTCFTIYLDKCVSRDNLTSLQQATGAVLNGSSTTAGGNVSIVAQDQVTDSQNASCKISISVTKGKKTIDFRGVAPPKFADIQKWLGIYLPGYQVLQPTVIKSQKSLRKLFTLYVSGSVAKDDITVIIQSLQRLWNIKFPGSVVMGGYSQESVGSNGETTTAIYYSVSGNGTDYSPTSLPQQPPSPDDFNQTLSQQTFPSGKKYKNYPHGLFTKLVPYNSIYSYYVVGDLDWDDGSNITSIIATFWQKRFDKLYGVGKKRVQLTFLGKKPFFGPLGSTVSQLMYTVSINGVQTFPDQDAPPDNDTVSNISAAVQQTIPSVVPYNLTTLTRQDTMYSVTLVGTVQNSDLLIRAIKDDIMRQLGPGNDIQIQFSGVQSRVGGGVSVQSPVTKIFFTVSKGGQLLSVADKPIIFSSSISGYQVRQLADGAADDSFQVQTLPLISDSISVTDYNSFLSAVQLAWKEANPGLCPGGVQAYMLKAKGHNRGYSRSGYVGFVTKMNYIVSCNGVDITSIVGVNTPKRQLLSKYFSQYLPSAPVCGCQAQNTYRLVLKSSSNPYSQFDNISQSLTGPWASALNVSTSRVKLTLVREDNSSSSNSSDAAVIDYMVDVDGIVDPDPGFAGQPNDTDIQGNLTQKGFPPCLHCNVTKCRSVYVRGKDSDLDKDKFQRGIRNAYGAANGGGFSPDNVTVSVSQTSNFTDKNGGPVTKVAYCAQTSADVDVNSPSENDTTTYLAAQQIEELPSNGTYVASGVTVVTQAATQAAATQAAATQAATQAPSVAVTAVYTTATTAAVSNSTSSSEVKTIIIAVSIVAGVAVLGFVIAILLFCRPTPTPPAPPSVAPYSPLQNLVRSAPPQKFRPYWTPHRF